MKKSYFYYHEADIKNIESILENGLTTDKIYSPFGSYIWANKIKNIKLFPNSNDAAYFAGDKHTVVIIFYTNKSAEYSERGFTFDDDIDVDEFKFILYQGDKFTIEEFKNKMNKLIETKLRKLVQKEIKSVLKEEIEYGAEK